VDLSILSGTRRHAVTGHAFLIRQADDPAELADYRRLRRESFVRVQNLFAHNDIDDVDDDPRTVVLVAVAPDGTVLGGVRLGPVCSPDIGWWTGSRLVTTGAARATGVGQALIRAACARAESAGVLRFEAAVQLRYAAMFTALGWRATGECVVAGVPHASMQWPLHQMQRLADATKSFLGDVLAPLRDMPGGLGPAGFVGDDGVPVPNSDVVAACDAIIPSMVERDPEWAGWCSVLVNVNDLTAMGAEATGLLDAVGAPTRSLLTRIMRGLAKGSAAWGVPVLGGHTQLGVPAALSVTALGRTRTPVRAGGGAAGDAVRLTTDLAGSWRPGYHGRQWDSTSTRSRADLQRMARLVGDLRPRAAKDVSMAGIVGTAGMLAEASGTGVEIDVAAVPRPAAASVAEWLTCFPGYAMLTVDGAGSDGPVAPPGVASAECGRLVGAPGVRLVWPDGTRTTAVATGVTGLGEA
jgi:putative N-acetyltransferase (TIGR04045 family)